MPPTVRYPRVIRTAVRGKCLGLKLRREFQGGAIGPTSVELANGSATGASQVPAEFFLSQTYPGALIETALAALEEGKGRPLLLCGPPGSGKSHTLGALHHCLDSPVAYERWLRNWDRRLERDQPTPNRLRRGVQVLSKGLDNSGYQFLADYILGWHLRGEWARAEWERTRKSAYENPTRELLNTMFKARPAVFIFDGFEPWLETLPEGGERRLRTAAVDLIKTLTSIAAEHPDRLGLVFAIDEPTSEAFKSLASVEPLVLKSDDECFRRDRAYRLVQRIFENRWEIPEDTLRRRLQPFVARYASISKTSSTDADGAWSTVLKSWPFTPGLIELIDDRIAVNDPAQATRIVFKLFVDLFEKQSRRSVLITLSDIGLTNRDGGIADWLSAAMDKSRVVIRDKAIDTLSRALASARRPRTHFPHATAIMTSLWVRSIPPQRNLEESPLGADVETLLLDVTHNEEVDLVQFETEVGSIAEVALYVHRANGRYRIREEPNPRSHLLVEARNFEHFKDGSDQKELARQMEHVLGVRREIGSSFRLVILPKDWRTDPWSALQVDHRPSYWDGRIILVAIPESSTAVDAQLGTWLKNHVHERRNTVRFLLPTSGAPNIYTDPKILSLVRGMLLARRWESEHADYAKYHEEFRLRLRDLIRKRFDRFALLDRWYDEDPSQSAFHIVEIRAEDVPVADAVDSYIRRNLIEPGDFDELLIEFARSTETVATVLRAAQEPAPDGRGTIPWLGRRALLDKLAELCAKGRISVDLPSGHDDDESDGHETNPYKRIYDEIHKNPEIEKGWLKYRTSGSAEAGNGGSLANSVESLEGRPSPLSTSEQIYGMAESASQDTRTRLATLLETITHPSTSSPSSPSKDKEDS